ncbi:MAG: T9SS type A sorting domain-containing protein, partial [Bacteroidales bacterium]|nr:T9SS type A sorting domain-containing protein [Bacteroidales bacterium]
QISNAADEAILLTYSNNSIRTWKTDAEFIRPKWGIYRSLNNPDDLRDEILYFANFVITESKTSGFYNPGDRKKPFIFPNPAINNFEINYDKTLIEKLYLSDLNGKVVFYKSNIKSEEKFNIANLSNGVYFVCFQTPTKLIKTKLVKN